MTEKLTKQPDSKLVFDVTNHLNQICAKSRYLIEILNKEKSLLTNGLKVDLQYILPAKEKIIQEIGSEEKKCQKILSRLAPFFEADQNDFTIAELIRRMAGGPEAKKIFDTHQTLLKMLKEVFTLNQRNASLLKHAQYYNSQFISMILNSADASKGLTYDPQGQQNNSDTHFLGKLV